MTRATRKKCPYKFFHVLLIFSLLPRWAKERVETVVEERGARGLSLETIKTLGQASVQEGSGLRRPAPRFKTRGAVSGAVRPFLMWPVGPRKPPKTGWTHWHCWVFRTEILGFSVLSSRAYRDEEKLQYQVKIATPDEDVCLHWRVGLSEPWMKLAAELWQMPAIILSLFNIMTVFYQTIFSPAPSD